MLDLVSSHPRPSFQERDSGHVGYDGYDRARNLMPLRLSSAEVAACHQLWSATLAAKHHKDSKIVKITNH